MPEIPDYALDMHTRRGGKMGRGINHFYEEGSKVSPDMGSKYKEEGREFEQTELAKAYRKKPKPKDVKGPGLNTWV